MCGGGGQAPDNSAQIRMQEQQMALQREQMAMQQEQMAAQSVQYKEQLAISKAPPPPAPNEVAKAAMPALETPMAENLRTGMGRRKLRTDVTSAGLNIPGVG
jgi:hypothetical protein